MNQKEKSEKTRQLIIDCAFSLFYQKGYNATSIPDIMKAAKLSKGAFYHHFEGKEELGEIVISTTVRKRIFDSMIAPLNAAHGADTVTLLCETFARRINDFSHEEKVLGCPANNLINEIGYSEKSFQQILRSLVDEWKAALVRVLEEGKASGEIRQDVDASSTAIYLIAAFEGIRGIRKVYTTDSVLSEYIVGVKKYLLQLR